MSDNFRAESRKDWQVTGIGMQLSDAQLQIGCLQRIADATELMAKSYQGLINERNEARKSRDYWMDRSDQTDRRLSAAKGQITKLKKIIAAAKSDGSITRSRDERALSEQVQRQGVRS